MVGYCKHGQEPMARKLKGPRNELTALLLLNGHSIKLPPIFISLYHRLARFSRVSLCSGLWLPQKPTTGPSTGSVSHKCNIHITHTLQGSRVMSHKKVWKELKSQKSGRSSEKQCLLGIAGLSYSSTVQDLYRINLDNALA